MHPIKYFSLHLRQSITQDTSDTMTMCTVWTCGSIKPGFDKASSWYWECLRGDLKLVEEDNNELHNLTLFLNYLNLLTQFRSWDINFAKHHSSPLYFPKWGCRGHGHKVLMLSLEVSHLIAHMLANIQYIRLDSNQLGPDWVPSSAITSCHTSESNMTILSLEPLCIGIHL